MKVKNHKKPSKAISADVKLLCAQLKETEHWTFVANDSGVIDSIRHEEADVKLSALPGHFLLDDAPMGLTEEERAFLHPAYREAMAICLKRYEQEQAAERQAIVKSGMIRLRAWRDGPPWKNARQ